MFSRFIVATDLSPASFAIVENVGKLRDFGARECLLLQCLNLQKEGPMDLAHATSYMESNLEEQKRSLEAHGFVTAARVVPGLAKTEINRIAKEENYSLVVVGCCGQTLIGEALLGGIADALIHHAVRPVLLLRLRKTESGEAVCIQASKCDFAEHVLFPTDFSENADRAFSYLEKIVSDGAKKVTLLHVQDKSRIDPHLVHRLEEFNEIDRSRLEKLKSILETKGKADIEIEVAYGRPLPEILRAIREKDARLVLMGSQGRGFVEEVFLGSVSHNVARQSEAPVLLIPAQRESMA